MPSYLDVLPRLLTGAISESAAAGALELPAPELKSLLARLGLEATVLAPIAFDIAASELELVDLHGCTLSEAFFEQSLERHVLAHSPVRMRVPARDIICGAEQYAGAPSAFIFHTGRCGSTLLANLLEVGGDAVLIKEPTVLSDLAAARLRARQDDARQWVDELLAASCRYLCGAVGKLTGRRWRALKLAAWNVGVAHVLLDCFPHTPAVFLFRQPAEVVSSLLFQPPAWHSLLEHTPQGQAAFFPSTRSEGQRGAGSPVELFSHAWRSAAEAALALPLERVLFVDYHALVCEPLATVERVRGHLGRPRRPELAGQLLAESQRYSKDSQVRFDPTGKHLRPALLDSERWVMERVVGSLPAQLDRRASAAVHAGVA